MKVAEPPVRLGERVISVGQQTVVEVVCAIHLAVQQSAEFCVISPLGVGSKEGANTSRPASAAAPGH